MEKAMDGGVETGVSILALLGIRQCAAKMSIKAKTATKPQSGEQTPVPTNEQMPVSHKTHQPQTKPVENIKTNNVEKFNNKSGSITKKVRTDINGKKMTVEYKYDKDGFNIISQTETYEPGYIYQSNPVKKYPKGMIKETTWKNGLRKEVCTDGDALTTNWFDRRNEIIRQEFSTPDKRGRIRYEKTNLGYKETYNDGHTFETRFNGNGWDYIKRYIDGSKQIRQNALVVEM